MFVFPSEEWYYGNGKRYIMIKNAKPAIKNILKVIWIIYAVTSVAIWFPMVDKTLKRFQKKSVKSSRRE